MPPRCKLWENTLAHAARGVIVGWECHAWGWDLEIVTRSEGNSAERNIFLHNSPFLRTKHRGASRREASRSRYIGSWFKPEPVLLLRFHLGIMRFLGKRYDVSEFISFCIDRKEEESYALRIILLRSRWNWRTSVLIWEKLTSSLKLKTAVFLRYFSHSYTELT